MAPDDYLLRLRCARWGALLALFTILFGFGFGAAFGAYEDRLKEDLAARAEAVKQEVYGGDEQKIASVLEKSWTYYKRAHLHGSGIGVVALGGILLLAALRRPVRLARAGVGLALGVGGFGYALFWMLAARRAPSLGGTGAAKESLEWLAVPSAGLLLIGLSAVLILTAVELFRPLDDAAGPAA